MADAAHSICTTAQVKTFLGITGTTYDTELEGLVSAVSLDVENYLGTLVIYRGTALTEYPEVDYGDKHIWTQNKPITSLDTFTLNDVAISSDTYTSSLTTGRITKKSGPWDCDGEIKIVYKYGYANRAAVPEPMTTAVIMAVAHDWQLRHNGDMRLGVNSKSKADGNLSFSRGWRSEASIVQSLSCYLHVKGFFG